MKEGNHFPFCYLFSWRLLSVLLEHSGEHHWDWLSDFVKSNKTNELEHHILIQNFKGFSRKIPTCKCMYCLQKYNRPIIESYSLRLKIIELLVKKKIVSKKIHFTCQCNINYFFSIITIIIITFITLNSIYSILHLW